MGRFLALTAVIVLGLLTASAGSVAAAPAPRVVNRCVVADPRLAELSGLASDGRHWYAINDGGTRVEVFVLGRDCVVQRVITAPLDPYDVEDLARAPDGTLWLSDAGDNRRDRKTVALIALSPSGAVTLHRLTFPDGPHDTEALLLDQHGTPFLVTKEVFGTAGVYQPVGPLATPGPTALRKVGEVEMHGTDTPGGPVPDGFGSVLVTGGAVSADGRVIALRTYTDAYLYGAPDGDVLAALHRNPVRIPLPNERQGEAIAFEPDGTLLSGSEGVGQPIRAVEHATALVTPALAAPTAPGTTAVRGGADPAHSGAAGPVNRLATLPALGIAAGVALVLVLGVGWLARRRRR